MFCCRRVVIDNENEMPNDYGTTPGGTIFGTTPGGIFFKDFLGFYFMYRSYECFENCCFDPL